MFIWDDHYMPVPDVHLRQIARWCEGKVPERVRHQVRVEHAVRGSKVTIFELREPWNEEFGPEWTRQAIAQLRFDGSSWWLYWPDRNTRWHLFEDVRAPAGSPGPLLDVIDDPRGPFWG